MQNSRKPLELLGETSLASDTCYRRSKVAMSVLPGAYYTETPAASVTRSDAKDILAQSRTNGLRGAYSAEQEVINDESTLKVNQKSVTHSREHVSLGTLAINPRRDLHAVHDTTTASQLQESYQSNNRRTSVVKPAAKIASLPFTPLNEKIDHFLTTKSLVDDIRSGYPSRRWINHRFGS